MPSQGTRYDIPHFDGCYHSLDGTTPDPSLLWFSQNVWPTDPTRPSSLRTRPGLVGATYLSGTAAGSLLLALPTTGSPGNDKLIMVAGGEIYEATAVGVGGWTKRISTANLTAAAITLTAAGNVWGCIYNRNAVISDGLNTPFTWDGTAGGGLTKLTNAPVWYGVPTVYYGKIFAILNSDRLSIVWSEENAANTGYTAGGYNNTWKLSQTSQQFLFSLAATNAALYYFRGQGIGRITGAVTPDFASSGTHDSVSQTVGVLTAVAPTVSGSDLYFIDSLNRPMAIDGVILRDLSEPLPAFLQTNLAGYPLPAYEATLSTDISGIRWFGGGSAPIVGSPTIYENFVWYWYEGADQASAVAVVFYRPLWKFLGYFHFGFTLTLGFQNMLTTKSAVFGSGALGPLLFILNVAGGATDCALSYFGLYNPFTSVAGSRDTVGATVASPTVQFITSKLGLSRDQQQHFAFVRSEAYRQNTNAVINLQYLTSQAQRIADMASAVSVSPAAARRESIIVGIAGYGRWISLVTTTSYTGDALLEWFGLEVGGFIDAPEPNII